MDTKSVLIALGREERLKITYLLTRGNFCQKHFEKILGINQSNSSRNLKKLLDAEVISYETVFCKRRYSINDEFQIKFPDLYKEIYTMYDNTGLKKKSYNSVLECDEIHKLEI